MKNSGIHQSTHSSSPSLPHPVRDPLDTAIEIVLMLAIGVTPLLFTSLTSELFEFPKMVFIYSLAIVGLVLIALKLFQNRAILLIHTRISQPIAVFVFAFIISTALSLDLYTSVIGYYTRFHGGFASLASYIILFYLTVLYLNDQHYQGSVGGSEQQLSRTQPAPTSRQSHPASLWHTLVNSIARLLPSSSDASTMHQPSPAIPKIHHLLWTWVISSTLVSVWAVFEHFGYDFGCFVLRGQIEATCWVQDVQARVFASFGQPNWLAAYLLTTLPITIYLLLSTGNKYLKYASWSFAVINYAAFWYTYSRAGWIGLAITVILLIPFIKFPNLKKQWAWLCSLLVATLLISASSVTMATQRTATSLESGELDSSTGQIRLLVWQGTLRTIAQYPILGSGPETFAYSFLPHRPAELNQTTEWNFLYNKAHNQVLHIAATLGLVGLCLWLWIHLRITQTTWSIYNRISSNPSPAMFVPFALFAGIGGVFTAQLLGFSVVMTGLLFWIAAAIIMTTAPTSITTLPLTFKKSLIFCVAVSILAVGLLYGLIRYTAAEIISTQAEANTRLPSLSIQQSDLAIALNPYEPKYHSRQARSLAQMAQWSPQDQQWYIDNSLYHAEQAVRRNPHNILTLKSVIFTYQILGKVDKQYYDKAIQTAQQALHLDENDIVIRQALAESYNDTGQSELALEQYNVIIEQRPESADSYLDRAEFYLQTNQPDLAINDFTTALKLDPGNSEIIQQIQDIEEEKD